MPKVKSQPSSEPKKEMRPALTPEAEEAQMVALAMDCARQQLMDGTASSQVITHFLKLGTMREKLELERLRNENKLTQAKTEEIEDRKELKAIYADAIVAMKRYQGRDDEVEDYEEY